MSSSVTAVCPHCGVALLLESEINERPGFAYIHFQCKSVSVVTEDKTLRLPVGVEASVIAHHPDVKRLWGAMMESYTLEQAVELVRGSISTA